VTGETAVLATLPAAPLAAETVSTGDTGSAFAPEPASGPLPAVPVPAPDPVPSPGATLVEDWSPPVIVLEPGEVTAETFVAWPPPAVDPGDPALAPVDDMPDGERGAVAPAADMAAGDAALEVMFAGRRPVAVVADPAVEPAAPDLPKAVATAPGEPVTDAGEEADDDFCWCDEIA
jgi:hypothetical protein